MRFIMKKIIILCLLSFIFSCSKKKEDNSGLLLGLAYFANSSGALANSPEANPANDNKATGIYKGVIVGSSGTFKINYDNSNTGSTIPVFDYSYTPTGGSTISGSINGTATVSGGIHTLTFTQSPFVLTIVLTSTGSITSATLAISGTTVSVTLYKERSTALVRLFEGTFTGNNIVGSTSAYKGVWNFTTYGELSFSSHTKILTIGASNCTSSCDTDYPSELLDSITKKIPNTPGTSFSCYNSLCSCQTYAPSNEGLTLSTNTVTGTWVTKIASTCDASALGLGTLTAGTAVASGTWTGTRTR